MGGPRCSRVLAWGAPTALGSEQPLHGRVCGGVLPDVHAVAVAGLAGDPFADIFVVVVVLVLAAECLGDFFICLYELVDRVVRVEPGFGEPAVDVVGAAVGGSVCLGVG